MTQLTTVGAYLKAHGREFPKPDGDDGDSISMDAYYKAGLSMIVACAHCEMTMVLTEDRACDPKDGRIFCDECA